ncbi:MAG: methyltransferase domain-containing protein [Gammaproteobacteria bacterium]|nr:methyltransferase domain-containing protein [Gammaproteobacteria bacterium]
MKIEKHLLQAGIFPYGSVELQLYEQRLTRYFSREYQRLGKNPIQLLNAGIPTQEGPMWKQTAALMEQHFDADLTLFQAFLDSRFMAYTMAYYGKEPAQILESKATLEAAESAKFDLICNRAGIRGNERIFNIGCGFGPLETYLSKRYPKMEITSITPSRVQANLIRNSIDNPSHPLFKSSLRLIEDDFGSIPLEKLGAGEYDLVFAIGAFEHVNNLYAAFQRIHDLLKPAGKAFLHLIVSKPIFPQYHDSRNTLIGRFFPGGHIWPVDIIKNQTDFLQLEQSWYLNGLNYWRTLEAWHQRFWQSMDRLYSHVLSEDGIRYWNDYFVLCKVVLFAPCNGDVYGNGHFLFSRQNQ